MSQKLRWPWACFITNLIPYQSLNSLGASSHPSQIWDVRWQLCQESSLVPHFIYLCVYLHFLFFRESMRSEIGEGERGWERVSSRLHAQHRAWCRVPSHDPEPKSRVTHSTDYAIQVSPTPHFTFNFWKTESCIDFSWMVQRSEVIPRLWMLQVKDHEEPN